MSDLDVEVWKRGAKAAAQYDRCTVHFLLGPWAGELARAAGVKQGDRLLDVACGTGAVSRVCAEHAGSSGQVTGLDLDQDMLAVARSHPHSTTIRWQLGDAAALPFDDQAFDVVVCQQGLQFFPNRNKGLTEMCRVLTAGGRLAIAVWGLIEHNPYYHALSQALEQFLGSRAREQMDSSFGLSDVGELHSLVTSAGFNDVRVDARTMTVNLPAMSDFVPKHLAGTALAGAVDKLDAKSLGELCAEISKSLESHAESRRFHIPLEVNIATAVAP